MKSLSWISLPPVSLQVEETGKKLAVMISPRLLKPQCESQEKGHCAYVHLLAIREERWLGCCSIGKTNFELESRKAIFRLRVPKASGASCHIDDPGTVWGNNFSHGERVCEIQPTERINKSCDLINDVYSIGFL